MLFLSSSQFPVYLLFATALFSLNGSAKPVPTGSSNSASGSAHTFRINPPPPSSSKDTSTSKDTASDYSLVIRTLRFQGDSQTMVKSEAPLAKDQHLGLLIGDNIFRFENGRVKNIVLHENMFESNTLKDYMTRSGSQKNAEVKSNTGDLLASFGDKKPEEIFKSLRDRRPYPSYRSSRNRPWGPWELQSGDLDYYIDILEFLSTCSSTAPGHRTVLDPQNDTFQKMMRMAGKLKGMRNALGA